MLQGTRLPRGSAHVLAVRFRDGGALEEGCCSNRMHLSDAIRRTEFALCTPQAEGECGFIPQAQQLCQHAQTHTRPMIGNHRGLERRERGWVWMSEESALPGSPPVAPLHNRFRSDEFMQLSDDLRTPQGARIVERSLRHRQSFRLHACTTHGAQKIENIISAAPVLFRHEHCTCE